MELLCHMVILFLILYAAVAVPISISTGSAQEFQFLPILTNTHFKQNYSHPNGWYEVVSHRGCGSHFPDE